MAKFTEAEREVVKMLIDTKAVDFQAIGTAVAKHGASAVLALDGEDVFCGTMRRFIRVFRIHDQAGELDQIKELATVAGEVRGR